ncbi:hypothetical protein F4808DRAFT_433084 [Astrocystis sublimbata]|nr:hypothetical protein F4808DRAFT_433084 [Astrocystis sublimbata]
MLSTSPITRAFLSTLAVVATSNTPVANAGQLPQFIQWAGLDSNEGPWHEPKAEFNRSLANSANITGKYPFPGPDTTSDRPEDSKDQWSWSIAVAADLPIGNSRSAPDDDGQGPWYYTGGKLTLNAPSSIIGDDGNITVKGNWTVCMVKWDLDFQPKENNNRTYPDKLRDDDGTCGSVLSDSCIAGMKSALRSNCRCPDPRTIPSCADQDEEIFDLFTAPCGAYDLTETTLRNMKNETERLGFGSKWPHHQGNLSAYNDIGSLAWPVMISFDNGKGYTSESLTCIRANNTVAESKAPEYEATMGSDDDDDDDDSMDPESSGSLLVGSLAKTVAVVAAVVSIAML